MQVGSHLFDREDEERKVSDGKSGISRDPVFLKVERRMQDK